MKVFKSLDRLCPLVKKSVKYSYSLFWVTDFYSLFIASMHKILNWLQSYTDKWIRNLKGNEALSPTFQYGLIFSVYFLSSENFGRLLISLFPVRTWMPVDNVLGHLLSSPTPIVIPPLSSAHLLFLAQWRNG